MYYKSGRTILDTLKYHRSPDYKKNGPETCPFCSVGIKNLEPVEIFDNFKIIKNSFPYHKFFSMKVIEHLMIVPNKHYKCLKEFTPDERNELMKIITDYESRGYDILARSPQDITRSVEHQHTHLFKADYK